MARTKIPVPPEKQCGYTSVIVSYSTGIDSTGAIYWATQNFAPEKIFLLYCDTGAEYSVNEALFFKTAKYHSTTLKTERKGKFECHWLRPVLDYEKGKMFEFGKRLGLDPHPCYEYIDRCSCMMCIFAKNEQVMENMKRHPEAMRKWVDAEAKLGFTWKQKTSLQELWDQCFDIDDVTETDTPEQAGGDAGCQQ